MTEPIRLEEKTIAKAGKCRKHGQVFKVDRKCQKCYLEFLLNSDEIDSVIKR
jgi:hypothetical protein